MFLYILMHTYEYMNINFLCPNVIYFYDTTMTKSE